MKYIYRCNNSNYSAPVHFVVFTPVQEGLEMGGGRLSPAQVLILAVVEHGGCGPGPLVLTPGLGPHPAPATRRTLPSSSPLPCLTCHRSRRCPAWRGRRGTGGRGGRRGGGSLPPRPRCRCCRGTRSRCWSGHCCHPRQHSDTHTCRK